MTVSDSASVCVYACVHMCMHAIFHVCVCFQIFVQMAYSEAGEEDITPASSLELEEATQDHLQEGRPWHSVNSEKCVIDTSKFKSQSDLKRQASTCY